MQEGCEQGVWEIDPVVCDVLRHTERSAEKSKAMAIKTHRSLVHGHWRLFLSIKALLDTQGYYIRRLILKTGSLLNDIQISWLSSRRTNHPDLSWRTSHITGDSISIARTRF